MKTRREFTPEFKREAVALLESSGRPLIHIATKLGIQLSMLRNCRAIERGAAPGSRAAQTRVPTAAGPPLPSQADPASENAKLRR
jgi:transposase